MKTKAFFNQLLPRGERIFHSPLSIFHLNGGWLLLAFFIFSPPLGRGWGWAVTASAQEAYAVYTEDNTTLKFYYDTQRSSRTGTTYGLNTGNSSPGWSANRASVTSVVFDSSFANARPTSTYYWFSQMNNLTNITGMEYLNTSEVTNMGYMFYYCNALTALDLSSFNTENVTDMGGMFNSCTNLTTIFVGDSWSTENVTNSTGMFTSCTKLVGGMGTTYDTNHVDAEYARIDGGPSNPGYFTDPNAIQAYTVYDAVNTTLTFYYDNQRISRGGDVLKYGANNPAWYPNRTVVTSVVFDSSFANARPTSTYNWFYGMKKLSSITGIGNLNTSEVTNMNGMFYDCSGLTSLNVIGFNTANVTDMSYMFYSCSALTSLDLSGFNTTKVTNMSYMFSSCRSLVNLDVRNFNTQNVTNMSNMFYYCSGLTSLDLSGFNTANVTDMRYMFYGCSNLIAIYVGDGWSTKAVAYSGYMFYNCTNLVGCMGTAYNYNHVNKEYARVDGGEKSPGYLTDPNLSQAYTVYDANNTTLTFYYDNQRISRGGDVLKYGANNPAWYDNRANITAVIFDSSFADARPTSTYFWFSGMTNLANIDFSNLNTSEVTIMSGMFYNCSGLTSLNVSSFNTEKVTYMNNMFSNCSGLTSLDLSNFNTANVMNTIYMFNGCTSLTILNLSSFNTQNVTMMAGMFNGCTNLTALDLSSFNTHNVTNMSSMFYGCSSLVNLGVSNFSTQNVTDMSNMYYGCSSLTTLNLSSFNTSNVTTMGNMFNGCKKLTALDLSSFNTQNVTNMSGMFYGCNALTALDLSSFNTQNVTNMSSMFNGCTNLTTIFVDDSWSTTSVTSSENMFAGCTNLVGGMGTVYESSHVDREYAHMDNAPSSPGYFIDGSRKEAYAVMSDGTTLTFYHDPLRYWRQTTTYGIGSTNADPEWYSLREDITSVTFDASFADARPTTTYKWFDGMTNLTNITGTQYLNTSEVTNMYAMFHNCSLLTSLDLSSWNTAKVTSMNTMFAGCSGLESLTLTGFDTKNVENMQLMFSGCESLTALDLGGWNTSKVTNMFHMFDGCTNLATLDVSGWNTSNVTNMNGMFMDCSSLQSLDLSSFDTAKVPSMYNMFAGCNSLATLDVSHFNTAKVTDMQRMFYNCNALKVLNLGSFNTSKVERMPNMFFRCGQLKTIYVGSGWSTESVTESGYMFDGCTSIVGGAGTVFSSAYTSHLDATRACIDGGSAAPGYLTDINAPYVAFSDDGCTMTFYKDGQRPWHTDLTYGLNTGIDQTGWYKDGNYDVVETVVFDESFATARPVSTSYWMAEMGNLTTITGIENLNTSEVTQMRYMFHNCSSLTSLDLSGFDMRKVLATTFMCQNCTSLTSVLLPANMTSIGYDDFWGCTSLKFITLPNGLTTIGMNAFAHCTGLISIEIPTSVSSMAEGIFAYCSSMKAVSVGWTTPLTVEPGVFPNRTEQALYVPQGTKAAYQAADVWKDFKWILEPSDVEAYVMYNASDNSLVFYYDHLKYTREGTDYGLNTDENRPGWYNNANKIVSVEIDPLFAFARPTSTYSWFNGMSKLEEITGLEYLNTSEVTNMVYMFYNSSLLTSLEVSHFDTGQTEDMRYMFSGCKAVESLDVSHFNTQNVTSMYYMFNGCSALTSLDVRNFDTQNVTTMAGMFSGCSGLTSLDVSSFDTGNVTTMASMFNGCTGLQHLNVSGFDTRIVTSMSSMFGGGAWTSNGCSSLTELDLSSFDTQRVTEMSYMFKGCGSMETIYVSDAWTTDAVTSSSSMFTGCTNIRGGKGTTWNDENPKDKTYARIDGGQSTPGYLTKKIDYLLGDVNGDGKVDVADVTALVNIVNNVQIENGQWIIENADVDGSGEVTSDDVPALVSIILGR